MSPSAPGVSGPAAISGKRLRLTCQIIGKLWLGSLLAPLGARNMSHIGQFRLYAHSLVNDLEQLNGLLHSDHMVPKSAKDRLREGL
jgi:hypothetical protein